VPLTHERLVPRETAPGLPPGRCAFATGVRAGKRVFLSGQTALQPNGAVAGLGDAAAQTEAALDAIQVALAAAGGSPKDIAKLTTSILDRDHRKAVYETIGRRLAGVYPVSTGLVVAGLALPELMVQIDAEAVVPAAGAGAAPVRRHRTFDMRDWFGQTIAWQGAMVVTSAEEIFIRGQTGSSLDG
jgi:enamine deaminase RidA (YjgF/YER057c/UK114 family)